MRFSKVDCCRILATLFVLLLWHAMLCPTGAAPSEASRADRPKDRADSVRAIVSYLGLSEGSVIGDIGAGNGKDTWVFAEIAGERGKVYPEEIGADMVESLSKTAEEKGLTQVTAVLGCSEDPCLPRDSADLIYMNRVYHHFAKPREMLRGIWRSLKPGAYLVVVDQRRGTLRDWVPRHIREEKHHWIAETTVVREAREEGFTFFACPDHLWHEKDPFVLIFRRAEKLKSPGQDPDLFEPVSVEDCCHLFLPVAGQYQNPVFIALGQARELMAPILEYSSGEGLDIILEEWATQKEERPPLPAGVSLPCVLTDNGDPHLKDEPIDVVFFLDSYHLLFHGKTLLGKIHEKLTPTGRVYVLDRRAKQQLSRREASHRRKIQPKMVEQEMTDAGFCLWFRGSRVASDRFLLVFGKARSEKAK
ncbi:MAG: methyltransferase domain-containing protein [Sedimentisphaerales bacterium]|nr:methyltransferase domain-containing protein [Sedimentisphaerales bacterium]